MRRHRVKGGDAALSQCFPDLFDLAGFAVERAADHQECAAGIEAIHLLDDRFRCMSPEHDFVHGAEYDPALVHALVLPRHGGLVGSLGGS